MLPGRLMGLCLSRAGKVAFCLLALQEYNFQKCVLQLSAPKELITFAIMSAVHLHLQLEHNLPGSGYLDSVAGKTYHTESFGCRMFLHLPAKDASEAQRNS